MWNHLEFSRQHRTPWKIHCVFVCMCIFVCVSVHAHACVEVRGQLKCGFDLQPTLREGFLLFTTVCTRLAGLQACIFSPVSTAHLSIGGLRLQISTSVSSFMCSLGIQAQAFMFAGKDLYQLRHLPKWVFPPFFYLRQALMYPWPCTPDPPASTS